jgi:hypothetical protein
LVGAFDSPGDAVGGASSVLGRPWGPIVLTALSVAWLNPVTSAC